jgi:hypothetical protein
MATTTNFGWTTPNDTDLVKDGAAAIRTLGSSIDTSMAGLKGGATGQVLSKTSNTDMAFTWVAQDDSNAIQNALVDAKGDLIAATAADTPARLAVGTNGQVLTADSTASTGLAWATPSANGGQYAAGKNSIINGAFNVWQRGTSFTDPNNSYTVDRWRYLFNGTGSRVVSQQSFTPGTAPVSNYEGQYFARVNQTTAGTGGTYNVFDNVIEDVRTFAGQAVTLSFWAKAAATTSVTFSLNQNFGSGGSTEVNNIGSTTSSITTSWTRYTISTTMTSISGKTIGTGSNIFVRVTLPNNATFTFDSWGWQLEAGSTATAFQTATGSIQGELAACQRYYYRTATPSSSSGFLTNYGAPDSTTQLRVTLTPPVPFRTNPTSIEYGSLRAYDGAGFITINSLSIGSALPTVIHIIALATSGFTTYRPTVIAVNGDTQYIGLSAEL